MITLLLAISSIVVVSLTTSVLLFLTRRRRQHGKMKLPPGPPSLPVLGSLLRLGPLPHRSLAKLHHTYGPLMYLRLGSVHTVSTDDTDIFKEMMTTQDRIFASRYQRIAIRYFCYNGMDLVMGPYGDTWKRLRRIAVEHLLSAHHLTSFQPHRNDEADCMVRFVLETSRAGELIPLRDVFKAFSLNNTTRMLQGKRFFGLADAGPESTARIAAISVDAFELMGAFNIGDYIPWLRWLDLQGYERRCQKVLQEMESLVSPVLEDHRARRKANPGAERTSFIDLLLDLQETQAHGVITDVMIKALILDLLGAGTDTTSVTNEWTMAHLLRHPRVMRKVQEELDEVVGTDRALEETDLPSLPYLRCVAMEVLRLTPPGPFLAPRECLEDTKVAGYDIPANTMVLFNVFAHGRNPKVWPDRPEEFVPERHMQNVKEKKVRMEQGPGLDFQYTTFGGGRRRCAGGSLAMTIVMLAVGRLVHSFNWEPPSNHREIDVREVFGMSAPLAVPLYAFATPRLSLELLS